MSAPRTKRQFAGAASDPAQRQITSFFSSPNSSSSSNSINQVSPLPSSTTQRLDSTPNLPASVQANLLSVGMRIRKSVPEGYKTGDYNAFALWDENDASSPAEIMGEGQRSRANAFSSPRELLPFCGIHKIGGLDTQRENHRPIPSMPSIHAGASITPVYQPSYGVSRSDIDDDMPGLTSSQETVESNASSITSPSGLSRGRTKKRFFEDEEEEIPGQLNIWRHNYDTTFSPRSLTPNNNGRAMAMPSKGRLRAKLSGAAMVLSGTGQENMAVDTDFEEAEFLDRGIWEVDMSDA
ncbi:ribonucleotide reductase inhibitor-domain-containing protein [Nemania abortiva]|nr:ribonucleotide reductase inhibitor-domain-containing protein [Nemania abortiva]